MCRYENLTTCRQRRQRGTDMNGNTPNAILNHDDLADTKSRSNLDSEGVK